MIKKQLYRAAAATVLGLSLSFGVAAADNNTGTITHTGPYSNNGVTSTTSSTWKVNNDNDLSVMNHNDQHAYTGDATSTTNTTAGGATTGAARNTNSLSVNATVNNAASTGSMGMGGSSSMNASGSITDTGPYSNNYVTSTETSKVTINNDNDLRVYNTNDQHASSGDATVSTNTTGGSATTGDASNTNSSTFTFNVSN